MVLYHITKKAHVPYILENGLTPNSGKKGITTRNSDRSTVVWLTDNVDYIVDIQLGRELFSQEYTVLAVSVDGLLLGALTVNPTGELTLCKHEYFVPYAILPNRITAL